MATRPRRLRGIHGLLSFMLVLNVLALINAALIRVSGQIVTTMPVDPTVIYGPQPYVLQQANRQLSLLSIEAYVREPSLLQTVLGLLEHGLATWIVTIPMIIYARRLVDRAVATQPFTTEMARGLRRLGLLVLAGGLLAELVRSTSGYALYKTTVVDDMAPMYWQWHFDFWWLILGLVILAFAQVVEHGCALRAELDEVI